MQFRPIVTPETTKRALTGQTRRQGTGLGWVQEVESQEQGLMGVVAVKMFEKKALF